MTDKSKTQEEWKAYVDQKYKGKTFSVAELDNERKNLEQKYGHEKILSEKFEDLMTDEEKMEWIEYRVLTD